MKRRCIVEKYKNFDGSGGEVKHDYDNYYQPYDIIGDAMNYNYLTLLLYSI